jgi:hypothetical protein
VESAFGLLHLMRMGRLGGSAPPGNPVTTPFPCFLSTERVCSEAEQGLPCENSTYFTGQGKG